LDAKIFLFPSGLLTKSKYMSELFLSSHSSCVVSVGAFSIYGSRVSELVQQHRPASHISQKDYDDSWPLLLENVVPSRQGKV